MSRLWIFTVVAFSGAASLCTASAAPAPAPTSTCVDVQISDDRTPYLNCLNEELQKRVQRERQLPEAYRSSFGMPSCASILPP